MRGTFCVATLRVISLFPHGRKKEPVLSVNESRDHEAHEPRKLHGTRDPDAGKLFFTRVTVTVCGWAVLEHGFMQQRRSQELTVRGAKCKVKRSGVLQAK